MGSASEEDVKGGGRGGLFYVFSFFHVSEHSEHICIFLLFSVEKINYFLMLKQYHVHQNLKCSKVQIVS